MPYTFIICILCVSLWRAVKVAAGDLDPFGPKFAVGLFDCIGAQPFKTIKKDFSNVMRLMGTFFVNIFLVSNVYLHRITVDSLLQSMKVAT